MDWRTVIGLAAGTITLLSILPYIRDILRGLTRPNLVTWWLWTLNGGILSLRNTRRVLPGRWQWLSPPRSPPPWWLFSPCRSASATMGSSIWCAW